MSIILWLSLIALVGFLSFHSINTKQKQHAHETLVNRVKHLRLYKMLMFLGADQDEYLRTVPAADINRQIQRCSSCRALDICDSCLHDGHRVDNMNFCPNYSSLVESSKIIHQHRSHQTSIN
jgi:hypothetical protein